MLGAVAQRLKPGHAEGLSAAERAIVWACASQLDEELARGADPSSDRRLAERAKQLSTKSARHHLAVQLRWAISASEKGRRFSGPDPTAQTSVLAERERLEQLAARVEAAHSPGIRGVAGVSLLLSEGDSPLWSGQAADTLSERVALAMRGLGHGRPSTGS